MTFADGQELAAEIGSLHATVGTGTVTVTTPAGVLALRFTDRSFAIGDGWNRLYQGANDLGFGDVVRALEQGGARVQQAAVPRAQSAVRRWTVILLVGLCFWGIEATIYAMVPTILGDVLAGATRVPYPYAVLTAVCVLGFGVAALLSLPTTAMIRAVIRQPKTASEFIDDAIYRMTGPRGAYMSAFLPLGLPEPGPCGTVYSVLLGRPWWRTAALTVAMLAVFAATAWSHLSADPLAEQAAVVGRGAIMVVVLAGYVLPGAEPVAVPMARAQRQLVWRRWCLLALAVGFAGGLATVAPFS
ncbi:MAG: hypothetical protein GEV07_18360 [Streptosporangiales bacterium]|nr:hypothetical protein [Streptosporangiales bacterium]